MRDFEQRLSLLEKALHQQPSRVLSDAERAIRLAALKPGASTYVAAWAIVFRHLNRG